MERIRTEALDFAGIGLYRYDWNGKLQHIDRGAMRILGVEARFSSPDELIGRDIGELIIYSGPKGHLRKQIREHGSARNFEYPFRTLDGEQRCALHDSFLTRDPVTGEESIQVIIRDITTRKRTEAALAAETERLAVTLRSIGDGVITTDMAGVVTSVNKVAEKLTGWTHEESVGQPLGVVFRIVNQVTREPAQDPVARVLQTGGIVGLANHTVLVARDGTERVIADSAAPIRDPGSKVIGVVLVFRDVTEKERNESEIQRVEKLSSIGLLAGGIAHDFNNYLAAILGSVSLARLYASPGSRSAMLLDQAEKATLRAKDLTLQLLTFSRGGEPVRKTADIQGVLQEAATFALSGSACRAEFLLAPDTAKVDVDLGQMSQVIHNLVLNAIQAMPRGGVIKLSCGNVLVDPSHGLPLGPGPYVQIGVADEGPGIPEDLASKVFEPYFTTKLKGSGLGLSIVHAIVVKHDGFIRAISPPGGGAEFIIWLPASRAADEPAQVMQENVLGGSGRILVMDDESAVLEVACQMLAHLGCETEGASSGEEALEKYRTAKESGKRFDAVILDLTVPGGMGGAEAVRKLLEIDPEAVAIASSGYSSDPVLARHSAFGFRGALAKPYNMSELGEVLCRVAGNGSDKPKPDV